MSSIFNNRIFFGGIVSASGGFGSGSSSLEDEDGVILLERGGIATIAEDGVDITQAQEEVYIGGSVV